MYLYYRKVRVCSLDFAFIRSGWLPSSLYTSSFCNEFSSALSHYQDNREFAEFDNLHSFNSLNEAQINKSVVSANSTTPAFNQQNTSRLYD